MDPKIRLKLHTCILLRVSKNYLKESWGANLNHIKLVHSICINLPIVFLPSYMMCIKEDHYRTFGANYC